jgi:5-methylcytosine-specific restriction endonuclease McrA
MAGDWIKMRGNLWDDPRVGRLVDMTDTSEAHVIGALYWLWATADQHSTDGVMTGLTLRQIDRKTNLSGLAAALLSIGWITDHPDGVRVERFDDHNGASAKKRLETARRVAKHRDSTRDDESDSNGEYKRLSIPNQVRKSVIARDGGCCAYCGKEGGVIGQMETKADGYIHLDHVIPLSQGGANDETNLVASCRKCNMKKSNKTPDQAGMEWPTSNGKRIGNKAALQEGDASVSSALAREREEKEKEETHTSPAKLPTCQASAVIDLYHEILPELPSVRLETADRKRAIRKLWQWVLTSKKTDGERRAENAEEALQWVRGYFARARENDFLMGRIARAGEHANWRCDLDFLLTDKGMKHVIEKTAEAS